jgi:hypothetical protein
MTGRRLLTDSEARGRQLSEIQFGPWGLFLGGGGKGGGADVVERLMEEWEAATESP